MSTRSVPLTHHSPGGGCACKLPQRPLDDVLGPLRADGATSGEGGGALRVGLETRPTTPRSTTFPASRTGPWS